MLYVIADTHSDIKRADKLVKRACAEHGSAIGEGDVLLILGDVFGVQKIKRYTGYQKLYADKKMVAWCEAQPFEIIALRGNHDTPKRLSLLGAEEGTWNGQPCLNVGSNLHYLDDGQIYSIPISPKKEIRALILGGAFCHAGGSYSPSYMQQQAFTKRYFPLMYAVEKIDVDFVFSHDAPTSKLGILRILFGKSVANDVFERILPHLSFAKWYYGHHHIDVESADKFSCIYKRVIQITTRPQAKKDKKKDRKN